MPAPVFVIAFANNLADPTRHLEALDKEFARLRDVLADATAEPRWELVSSEKTSIHSFLDLLQEGAYQRRIAMLHFAGHANGQSLMMESGSGVPEIADASGIAEFLKQHEGLGFVFLNACSTVGQVQALLDAGVPAVIATEFDINDAVAAEFSVRFYREFVNGQTLRKAFDAASAAVKTNVSLRSVAETRSIAGVSQKRDPSDWPWKLHVHEAVKGADQWSLGLALDDPLWGIPEPVTEHLPDAPYRHLQPFEAVHAPIFFGRRRETRQVYDAIERGGAARVVLLHGVSGAGKSSLLDAGLLPRLTLARAVTYRRRDPALTLAGNLRAAAGLNAVQPAVAGDLLNAWRALEQPGRPLTIILDQVEEALTASHASTELKDLVDAMREVFGAPAPPEGSIVLGFRKEWLAEVEAHLQEAKLAFTDIFLDRLDERGMIEAVEGVTRSAPLREHFKLAIPPAESGLAAEIAGDLIVDASSAIAPTLQVLLTKLWERAIAAPGAREFTRAMYQQLASDGKLLSDLVDQQIDVLHQANPGAVDSGLVLDLLAFHLSSVGDATRSVTREARQARYPEVMQPLITQLLTLAATGRLVTIATDSAVHDEGLGTTRLGHDTLAAYVRTLASQSVKPVQRASRILAARAEDWAPAPTQHTMGGTAIAEAVVPAPRPSLLRRAVRLPGRVTRGTWNLAVRGLPSAVRTVRDIILARPQLQDEATGRRTLDRADLRAVERALPWMPVLSRPEQDMLAASRIAYADVLRLRRTLAGGFAIAACAILLLGVWAWKDANRVRARGILASAGNETEDPLVRLLLMQQLEANTGPTNALQVATDVASLAVPSALLVGHHRAVVGAAFDSSETRVLTWSEDSTARIWAVNGMGTPTILTHARGLTGGTFSPDGRCVLTSSSDHTLRMWNAATGKPGFVFTGTSTLYDGRFSDDGSAIAAIDSGGIVRLWRRTTRTCSDHAAWGAPTSYNVREPRTARRPRFAFLSDGSLVTADFTGFAIHAPRAEVVTVPADGFHAQGITLSGDRQRLLLWGQGELRAFDLRAEQPPRLVASLHRPLGGTEAWSLSADLHGNRVVINPVSTDTAVVVSIPAVPLASEAENADPLEGQLDSILVLRGHRGSIATATFSADGLRVLTSAGDGIAMIWMLSVDPFAAHPLVMSTGATVRSSAFSRTGRLVVTSQDSTARIWPGEQSTQPVIRRTGARYMARAQPLADGRIVAQGETHLLIWDSTFVLRDSILLPPVQALTFAVDAKGTSVAVAWSDTVETIPLRGDASPNWRVSLSDAIVARPIRFSPDGEWLVVGLAHGAVAFRPKTVPANTTGRFSRSRSVANRVSAFAFYPGGLRLIAADEIGRRFNWDYRTNDSVAWLPSGELGSFAIAVNGTTEDSTRTYAYALRYGVVQLAQQGTARRRSLVHEQRGPVFDVAFNHAGTQVVTASADGTARVWSSPQGQLLMTLRGHSGPVISASFTADDSHVVTASTDGTLRIWAVTWSGLIQEIQTRTTSACLPVQQRQQYLGEGIVAATVKWAWCDVDFNR